MTYSTIRIERNPANQFSYFVPPTPPRTRGVAAIPIEDNRWEVIVQGVHGDDTPTDSAGFVEFLESMPVTQIYCGWPSNHVN